MCVLTYVPIGKAGFIVTSNRDENIIRVKAKPPKKLKINGIEIFCPIDPLSNGTWIATSKTYTMVLLNGGYKNHEKKPKYRQSRGRIIMDFMKWNNPLDFFESFEFENMQPFTLVLFKNDDRNQITEIKWCSDKKFYTKFNGESAQIWSSATLYDSIAIENRKTWFFNHLAKVQNEFSGKDILHFHQNGGQEDKENSIQLKRANGIQTVCITQIEIQPNVKSLIFNDLQTHTSKSFIIY